MSRQVGELTATEWERMERALHRSDRRRGIGWRAPRPEDAVSHPSRRSEVEAAAAHGHAEAVALLACIDVHVPTIELVGGGAWVARCSCGWSRSSTWRINRFVAMPEGYAWAEHDDHVRGVA